MVHQRPELALHLAAKANDTVKLQELISSGWDVDFGCRGTALHDAITSGHPDVVRLLLDAGADSEKPAMGDFSFECDNSLVLAAIWGRRAIVKMLWDHGVAHGLSSVRKPRVDHLSRVRKLSKLHQSAISEAASRGFDEIVSDLCAWRAMDADEVDAALFVGAAQWVEGAIQTLLQGGKATQDGLDEALWKAASCRRKLCGSEFKPDELHPQKQRRVIELLLDAGARINAQQGSVGDTALHISASSPDTAGAVQVLLERGADVHIRNEDGATAITRAMVKHRRPLPTGDRFNTDTITMLLQHGASAFVTDNLGQTPMHILAYYGPYSLFQFCLEHHRYPNIFISTLCGETMLHRAAHGNQVGIVERLLAEGARINDRSSSGWTALLFALEERLGVVSMLQVANLLLDHGAKATDITQEGWTALHRVADLYNEHHEGVTALIERLIGLGADTEAQAVVPGDIYQYRPAGYRLKLSLQTPLHWAASNGSVAVVKALLRHGANPVARDSAGLTPALCATYAQACDRPRYSIEKRQQVIKLLLTHGARFEDKDASGRGVPNWAAANELPLQWREW
ncbi:ankyrin repeat domain-containing protein 50 [Nannizzia gypsea CBS 118893]|uniref:Ankyrin repeat domain-containing protein 50 n=1 Tax=Arthroderma gypseum (strain ATCC MYA-4604 / CBS 118893) TaxID=535722 RepID=E4V6B0_ARTGP|nr:ankyrin repeat domain-containing protein 50 [Nannizzia gypsea CBS 118893]EFR05293.1 ankyrin repeat domain-containing protein 50 [Nannizzia gypsea CBS 118893]